MAQKNTSLYKGLLYDMPKKDAIKEFRSNKNLYNEISFGNGIVWSINKQNFTIRNDKLKALMLTPKSAIFGLSHDNAQVYLKNSFDFFNSKGYNIIIEPDYWDSPILYSSNNKFGLIMSNPDKTIVIELRSVRITANSYTVNLGISNYQAYMNYLDNLEDVEIKQQNKTGF